MTDDSKVLSIDQNPEMNEKNNTFSKPRFGVGVFVTATVPGFGKVFGQISAAVWEDATNAYVYFIRDRRDSVSTQIAEEWLSMGWGADGLK